jgi:hypothetical protein
MTWGLKLYLAGYFPYLLHWISYEISQHEQKTCNNSLTITDKQESYRWSLVGSWDRQLISNSSFSQGRPTAADFAYQPFMSHFQAPMIPTGYQIEEECLQTGSQKS